MPMKFSGRSYDVDTDLYYGADPVFIRPRRGVPIEYWRHWYRSIVSPTNAVDTTIAVRQNWEDPLKAYVAFVAPDGTLTVRSAIVQPYAQGMEWQTELTVAGCVSCSLCFDGSFIRDPGNSSRTLFKTDELPWLFYSTAAGSLMAGVVGGTFEAIAAANVVSLDAVRGVASAFKDFDQGLLVFYVVDGSVYFNSRVGGAWQGQETVSIAPANAVNVRASRVFDWRIVLHVEDSSGTLYEVFTKMETSGWSGTEYISMTPTVSAELLPVEYYDTQGQEYITFTPSVLAALVYGLAPEIVSIENIADENDDYGFLVRITFDSDVSSVAGNTAAFFMVDDLASGYSCTGITQGSARSIIVAFEDFNSAMMPLTIAYTPGTITGAVEPLATFSEEFEATGLVPVILDPPVPVSIENIEEWSVV